MSKQAFIAAHEALVEEQMEATGCDWEEAYNSPELQDKAYDRMMDRYAEMADELRQRAKDAQ